MGNAASARRRGQPLTYDCVLVLLNDEGKSLLQDKDDFRLLFSEAVSEERLDVLELLIDWGGIRGLFNTVVGGIFPVHIAAREGKLEALDLFLSAGLFSASSYLNDVGDSPLHLCAENRSLEAAHCALVLAHRGGTPLIRLQAVNRGHASCLHVAARCNNARFVQAILHCLTLSESLKLAAGKDDGGQTPLHIAKTLSNVDVAEVFDRIRHKQKGLYEIVDQERILKVWERFFENAARRMAGEDFLEDEPKVQVKSSGPARRAVMKEENREMDSVFEDETLSPDWAQVRRMWQNIVCYDKEAWYVLDKFTGQSIWLVDFLRNPVFCNALQLQQLEARGRLKALPSSVIAAVKLGWLPYFDHVSNLTFFLNSRSWQCEQYLPIGRGAKVCAELGLSHSSNDGDWVGPDQVCCFSWVQVLLGSCSGEEEGGDGAGEVAATWESWPAEVTTSATYYYWNRITGHKAWLPPPGWAADPRWPGWVLCAEDTALESLWWWHAETDQAVWCEPTADK